VALAAAGAHVTHVDASRPAIGWARENAALNGVSTIRWIHEDARRFVDRERRRGRQYDALLLDPPAFGRGPAGDWQLDRDLAGLLEAAIALLRPDPAFVLLNVYTGDLDAGDLDRLLAWALDARPDAGGLGPIEADTLSLTSADGRHLPTGVYARAARGRT
jgi:23S rRNA (cytosine1962-C5)-methyltransferase